MAWSTPDDTRGVPPESLHVGNVHGLLNRSDSGVLFLCPDSKHPPVFGVVFLSVQQSVRPYFAIVVVIT